MGIDSSHLFCIKYLLIDAKPNVDDNMKKCEREELDENEVPETASPTIESSDKREIKKSSKTLILDAVILTDVKIICISSVCCDLRFYDCSTMNKCILRLYVRNFPSLISALHYHQPLDNRRNAQLIIGDFNGTVRVIDFMKNSKIDFHSGSILCQISQISNHTKL
ncbi:CLUMA_CG002478, isoform A [Clunio marinus]|uniref:CLUMA_CG002478, isoform A n=1 Tax=Clunio marinus TaxID=568069 RepID=A0A1J1HKP8_9DIPT|nr:CLUMA_CG002478, isoform A [Clunio marinus]